MANRLKAPSGKAATDFPPEANDNFDEVSNEDIAKMQEHINQKYGFEPGKLIPIEEPH